MGEKKKKHLEIHMHGTRAFKTYQVIVPLHLALLSPPHTH